MEFVAADDFEESDVSDMEVSYTLSSSILLSIFLKRLCCSVDLISRNRLPVLCDFYVMSSYLAVAVLLPIFHWY